MSLTLYSRGPARSRVSKIWGCSVTSWSIAASTSARKDGCARLHCVFTVPLPSGHDEAPGPAGVGVGVGGGATDPPVGELLPPPQPKAPIPTTSASLNVPNRVFLTPTSNVHALRSDDPATGRTKR